ncbi:amino acid ABC transporter permease [Gammaproteobacteria bacterium 45_16_T64]|nr:amino acid ABC transporter permease [Gammaproteobacteria bacterium 45_16_T64]
MKFNTRKTRAWIYQALFIACIIAIGSLLIHTLLQNLEQQGIVTGFNFLSQNAGFGIVFSLIDYSESDSYGRVFWVGLTNTLLVAGLGILFATIIGFVVGVARLSNNFLAKQLASFYISLFRNVPLLLHLFFWYFAILQPLPGPRQSIDFFDMVFLNNRGLYIPKLISEDQSNGWLWLMAGLIVITLVLIRVLRSTHKKYVWFASIIGAIMIWIGVAPTYTAEIPTLTRFNFSGGIVIIPELTALVLALSLYTASYIAEIVRAGISSVDKGQVEAAQSLGLRPNHTLRLIIIPQAMRLIVPPLTNQYLNLTKNSSLAAAIAYPDLVSIFAGTTLNQTGQAVEILFITMLVYLSISLSISFSMSLYERSKQWSKT